jgi:uracil permease
MKNYVTSFSSVHMNWIERTFGISEETQKRYGMNLILGCQHTFAMMGATTIVAIICNLQVSVTLIAAGLGTIAFYFVARRKVPVFLGSSFAFVTPMLSIASYGAERGIRHDEVLGRQVVAVMVAGVLYFIFAAIAYFTGPQRIKKLFPPAVVGPIVIVIGMTLAPTVISSNIVQQYTPAPGGTAVMKDYEAWIIAIVTATIIVCVSIFAPGIWKLLPVLLGIIGGYIVSACFQVIDYDVITDAHWFIFEKAALAETFGFYKHLDWDWSVILMLAPIAIVTLMEHMGDITTVSAIVGEDFFEDPGVHFTLFGDGLATCIAGFLGAPPNTTYSENVGVMALTKNYDPKVMVVGAVVSIVLGVVCKFGGVLTSVPGPVIGGASMILFGMIAAMGIKVLVDNRVDFIQSRNVMIVAAILIIGLGFSSGGVDVHVKDVSISALAIATVAGVLLNLVLPGAVLTVEEVKYDEISSEPNGDSISGMEPKQDGEMELADNPIEA